MEIKEYEHRGKWLQTYTGRAFFVADPRSEDFSVVDIAHALANQCRFTGHTKRFYSVAQHCVLASRIVPPEDAGWGLLHDATEAYLCDIARPVKCQLSNYRSIEQKLMIRIAEHFDLPYVEPDSIAVADLVLLATERRDLMGTPPMPLHPSEQVRPLSDPISPLCPMAAEKAFLARFRELFPQYQIQ